MVLPPLCRRVTLKGECLSQDEQTTKSNAHAVLRQHNDARPPAIWAVVISIAASESLRGLLAQTSHSTGKSEEPLPTQRGLGTQTPDLPLGVRG